MTKSFLALASTLFCSLLVSAQFGNDVTFNVDMSQQSVNQSGVYLLRGDLGYADPFVPQATYEMLDTDGDNIYSVTLNLDEGFYYLYANGDELEDAESFIPDACTVGNARLRYISPNTTETTVCFNLCCEECPESEIAGCTSSAACNYNPLATISTPSCLFPDGCTNSNACNYNVLAKCDDGSCSFLPSEILYNNQINNCFEWTSFVATEANQSVSWVCGTGLAPSGNYPIDPIASTSYDNGCLMVDSDLNGNQFSCENTWVQSNFSVDLTNNPNVIIGFENYYRRYDYDCPSYCLLEISRDGVTWPNTSNFAEAEGMIDYGDGDGPVQTRWDVFPDYQSNQFSLNPEWKEFDISDVAGGQETIWVRFRWSGSFGYAWMIDDIAIYEERDVDLSINNYNFFQFEEPIDYTVWHPSQSTFLAIESDVLNSGSLQASNVTLEVTENSSLIGVENVNIGAGQSTQATFSYVTPTTPGFYNVQITADNDMDECSGNNIRSKRFEVPGAFDNTITGTGGQYAKDNGVFGDYVLQNNAYPNIYTELDFFGDAQIHTIQAAIIGGDCDSPVSASIVYREEDSFFEYTPVAYSVTSTPVPSELINTGYESPDEIKWMRFVFDPPIDVSSGDRYLVGINKEEGANISVGLAQTGTGVQGFVENTNGDFFVFDTRPMIRVNLDPLSAAASTSTCKNPEACNYDPDGFYNDESMCVFTLDAVIDLVSMPECGLCNGVLELNENSTNNTYQWYNGEDQLVFEGSSVFDSACIGEEYYVVISSLCDAFTTNTVATENVQEFSFEVNNLLDPAACGTDNNFNYGVSIEDVLGDAQWIEDNTVFYINDEDNTLPSECIGGQCYGLTVQNPIETTTYTIGVIYTDICGNNYEADSTFTINVIPPDFDLEIDANPTSGNTPIEVTFDNQTPDDENYTFTWDFGDGTIVQDNGSFVQHTYESGGVWDVTLTAVDNLTGCVDVLYNEEYIFSIGDGCPEGCTDSEACNYDAEAECDDGSCLEFDECGECGGNGIAGCTNPTSCNYIETADCDDGSCLEFDECGDCGGTGVAGCTNSDACNYNAAATCDDGSCAEFDECGDCGGTGAAGCTNNDACNYNSSATCDDNSCYFSPTITVSGSNIVSAFTSEAYETALIEGASYLWTVDGGVIDGVNNEYNISVFWADEGQGEVCVTVELGECEPILSCNNVVITPDDTLTGCTNSDACNYDPEATTDNGNCIFIGDECNDGNTGTINDEIQSNCECQGVAFPGCMNPAACNYDDMATIDDGTCFFVGDSCDDQDADTVNDTIQIDCECEGQTTGVLGCTDPTACNFNPEATEDDGSCDFVILSSISGNFSPIIFNSETYTYSSTTGSTYEWTCTGGAIQTGNGTNEIEVVWSATGAGEVCVTETTADECSGEQVCSAIAILPTNIEEQMLPFINIFPNPASTSVTISIDESLINASYQLFDAQGRKVKEGLLVAASTALNTTALASGNYVISIETDQGVVRQQIIIER